MNIDDLREAVKDELISTVSGQLDIIAIYEERTNETLSELKSSLNTVLSSLGGI